ncbi:glutathione S-transferase family protein [Belnapia sp. T6]|uniref:Glutathione S-transferase family protein n=1 Tax=Belnapia mucosa TaxID=2804532 RepID=A0ABS1UYZ8_9PROT|nr:glutathione S-transferase family protein [Belnapia mucosa]MBL6454681.1 glutathione S-transferase family protein [Belnapia mucosa]
MPAPQGTMQLHWSSRSPFVRKVMVCVHERGLEGLIERIPTVVALTRVEHGLLPRNPLGRIPTLVRPDGSVLFDSVVICEYLDGLGDAPRLFPEAGPARIEALQRHALGTGFMEMLLLWRGESLREVRSPIVIEGFELKREAVLPALEALVPTLEATPYDIGHVAIGCSLSYLDFRWGEYDWRAAQPRLAAWHAGFSARPAVQATAHIDA